MDSDDGDFWLGRLGKSPTPARKIMQPSAAIQRNALEWTPPPIFFEPEPRPEEPTEKDYENMCRDLDTFRSLSTAVYGPDTRPEVLELQELSRWEAMPPYSPSAYGKKAMADRQTRGPNIDPSRMSKETLMVQPYLMLAPATIPTSYSLGESYARKTSYDSGALQVPTGFASLHPQGGQIAPCPGFPSISGQPETFSTVPLQDRQSQQHQAYAHQLQLQQQRQQVQQQQHQSQLQDQQQQNSRMYLQRLMSILQNPIGPHGIESEALVSSCFSVLAPMPSPSEAPILQIFVLEQQQWIDEGERQRLINQLKPFWRALSCPETDELIRELSKRELRSAWWKLAVRRREMSVKAHLPFILQALQIRNAMPAESVPHTIATTYAAAVQCTSTAAEKALIGRMLRDKMGRLDTQRKG